MLRYDRDKNNKQVFAILKLYPYLVIAWIVIEALSGNIEKATFIATALAGFWLIDNVLIRSGAMSAIRRSEKNNRFQWKFELLLLAFIALVVWLSFTLSNLVGKVI